MEIIGQKDSSVNIYKVSALSALGMILFFLLMKILGMVTIVEFRFLNVVIMFIGIRYVLINERRAKGGKLEYLPGMLKGFMTALFASILFSVFIFIYLSIDTEFMEYLKATQLFGSYLTPASSALVSVIEGIAGGSIITFAIMNLYKG